MKITIKQWTKGKFTRYYVSDINGNSVGYYEARETERGDSSYDLHRLAKGDLTVESLVINLAEEIHEKIVKAIGSENIEGKLVIDSSSLASIAKGVTKLDPRTFKRSIQKGEVITLE